MNTESTESDHSDDALSIDDVSIRYLGKDGVVEAVSHATLNIGRGECVGVVGESGSGKSTLAAACVGMLSVAMLNRTAIQIDGSIRMVGHDITDLKPREWETVRGARVGFVGQDPFGALNPVLRVREHMNEALRLRPRKDRARLTEELLASVELAPETAMAFPHELSGGMRQRVAIAMAVANSPELLIADEPTTALDVTTQAEILKLLSDLRARTGMALMLISHDLGVIGQVCDRVYVMYAGSIVEHGQTRKILSAPDHPYTQGLLRCARLDRAPSGEFLDGYRGEAVAEAGSPALASVAAAKISSESGGDR